MCRFSPNPILLGWRVLLMFRCSFAFSGLVSLHKPANPGRRSTDYWQEGLKILDACKLNYSLSTLTDCTDIPC